MSLCRFLTNLIEGHRSRGTEDRSCGGGSSLDHEVQIMSDAAPPAETTGLPRDLTEAELEHAPVLESVDELLIDDLTDVEADAFYAALDA